MLRDEKDWVPERMIEVTESYGRMNLGLKEMLSAMTPKENSDQRKSRHRNEARAQGHHSTAFIAIAQRASDIW